MIPLSEFKVLLGSLGGRLSEEEIEQLYADEYMFAEAVVEWWIRKQSKDINDTMIPEDNLPNINF